MITANCLEKEHCRMPEKTGLYRLRDRYQTFFTVKIIADTVTIRSITPASSVSFPRRSGSGRWDFRRATGILPWRQGRSAPGY